MVSEVERKGIRKAMSVVNTTNIGRRLATLQFHFNPTPREFLRLDSRDLTPYAGMEHIFDRGTVKKRYVTWIICLKSDFRGHYCRKDHSCKIVANNFGGPRKSNRFFLLHFLI